MRAITLFLSCFIVLLAPAQAQWSYQPLFEFRRPGAASVAPLVVLADGRIYGTCSSGGASGGGTIFRVAAGKVETLVDLNGTTGTGPAGGLVSGPDGNFYGTCSTGGANQFGTFFCVSPAGVFTKLFDFTGTGGANPGSVPGELVLHLDGSFYGATRAGGSAGFGTVFKVTTAGVYTVLATFSGNTGATKGSQPVGRLAIFGTNLYGLTRFGGAGNLGSAYQITTAGNFTPLFDFTGVAGSHPGANPEGGFVLHSDGNLYGTAEYGGASTFGTAFRLTTANSFTLLHQFSDPTASQPVGELVEGTDGFLYGAAAAGSPSGFGGWFRISTSGAYQLRTSFNGANGAVPQSGLIRTPAGLLLGVTSAGGPGQLGVVCSMENNGTFTVIAPLSPDAGWHPSGAPLATGGGQYAFPVAFGGNLGGGAIVSWSQATGNFTPTAISPAVGLQPDGRLTPFEGSFWGLASTGGTNNAGASFSFSPGAGITLRNSHLASAGSRSEGPLTPVGSQLYGVSREGGLGGRGSLFSLGATGARTTILSFTGISNSFPGRSPRGPLALAPNGALYGLTELGGSPNLGVIFKLTLPATYQILAEFDASGPRSPRGGWVASGGFLYATTSLGGTQNSGALIRLNPNDDTWTTVASFPATAGAPEGELFAASDGSILGFATSGGTSNAGAIFRYHPSTGLQIITSLLGTNGSALSTNSSGIKFTGGFAELAPGEFIGLASGGGSGGGGVFFSLIHSASSPINAWKTNELAGFNPSDIGDPDQDGLATLVEYALGSDPRVGDPTALPQPVVVGGHLQITLPRDPSRNDVDCFVESSASLTSGWTVIASSLQGSPFSGSGYVSGETPGASIKAVVVRIPTATASQPRNFIRIRVVN
ncbi:MAG: choice-of-anchor tandem repeat GloVer-containing protein [Luteolibacter sp.]